MINHDPEGCRKLLAYQKAQKLHDDVLAMIEFSPKSKYRQNNYENLQTKTIGDLGDQMARSGRSTHKNIVEGWKRTKTKEYFDFLSFSIGSNSELKDDAADIVVGKYKELMGVKEVTGEKGDSLTPLTYEKLSSIKFYPLDETLPSAVKIYLQAKEVNFLLHKLQKSLDLKMDKDNTKPLNEKIVSRVVEGKKADEDFKKYLTSLGIERLENGKYVSKGEKREEGD